MFFIQCKNENKTTLKTSEIDKEVKKPDIKTIELKTKELFKNQFVFKNDTLVQTLFCDVPKNRKINFKLTLVNLLNSKSKSFEGVAKLLDESDGESDVDNEGNGYSVDEYEYIETCSVILRIDSDENKRARIKITNCKEKNNPFEDYSLEIMNSN
jgi:hypothetical protein